MKFAQLYKAVLFIAIVFGVNSSCKKEDAVLPDYVGTWMAMETYPVNGTNVSIKEILTLSPTGYSDTRKMQSGPDQWIDLLVVKASLAVTGNLMNVTLTEVGSSAFSATGMPTGTITSYKTGSAEFDDFLIRTGQSETFKLEKTVAGGQLTLKTDINADGDFQDKNETTVYIKQ